MPDRLRACERCEAPDPAQPAERAAELSREHHLRDDVAALAAVLLGNAQAVVSGLGELVPELERVIMLLALQLARIVLRASLSTHRRICRLNRRISSLSSKSIYNSSSIDGRLAQARGL